MGSVSALKNCWEILKCENISFVTLVTGAFPPAKAQDSLLNELRSHRFFDVFEYNALEKHWGCFLCNHPDRAHSFVQEQVPVIEGQLKEGKAGTLLYLVLSYLIKIPLTKKVMQSMTMHF